VADDIEDEKLTEAMAFGFLQRLDAFQWFCDVVVEIYCSLPRGVGRNCRSELFPQRSTVGETLKVANVEKAIEPLVEVWKRKDAAGMNAGWAVLARERGWHLLLGYKMRYLLCKY